MPMWKVRDPDRFPKYLHDALAGGLGERKVIVPLRNEKEQLLEARRLRSFRKSLAVYTEHSLSKWETGYRIRGELRHGVAGRELWVKITSNEATLAALSESLK